MDEEKSQPSEAPSVWPVLESALDEREGPAASADSLRGILVRHDRHRRRLTGGIAAAVLAIGLGGGAAIGEVVASSGGQLAATGNSPSLRSPTAKTPPFAISAPSASGRVSSGSGSAGLHVFSGVVPAAAAGAAASSAAGVNPSAQCPGGCASPVPGVFMPTYKPLTRLFNRTANGVTIRAFTVRFPFAIPLHTMIGAAAGSSGSGGAAGSAGSGTTSTGSAPAGSSVSPSASSSPSAVPPIAPICSATQQLLVEVSNFGAVGQITVPSPLRTAAGIAYVDDEIVGSAEGSPIAVVAVRVGSGAATVEARFGNGTYDVMNADHGWAVLATSLSGSASAATAAAVNVVVLNAAGKQISQVNISSAPSYALPEVCVAPVTPWMPSGPPTGLPNRPGSTPGGAPASSKVGSSSSSSSQKPK
jgi:hypothetical protein